MEADLIELENVVAESIDGNLSDAQVPIHLLFRTTKKNLFIPSFENLCSLFH